MSLNPNKSITPVLSFGFKVVTNAIQMFVFSFSNSYTINLLVAGKINPDFRIENFHFKHEISLLHLFTRPSFVSEVVIRVNISLK